MFGFGENITLDDWPYIEPPTIDAYDFEKFDALKWRKWMAENWPLSIIISGIYLTLIFGGRNLMRCSKPFEIKGVLAMWNIFLATFSFIGFARTFPELYQVVNGTDGLHRSICTR